MYPTLHKPVPMNSRVMLPEYMFGKDYVLGTVVGISSAHIIFTYIVQLDNPEMTSFGEINAVVINGTELQNVDGTNWRL